MTDKPTVTPLPEGTLSALGYLLRFECDCPPNYTERNRHAPDCRYQFVHDYLDDGEIEAILDAARAGSADLLRALTTIEEKAGWADHGSVEDGPAFARGARWAAGALRTALDKEPKP